MSIAEEPFLAEVLSPTQVSQFLNCPAKWMFRYLLDLKEPGTRLVKIFMRRDCRSIGVGRRDVLDSGCHAADPAQAEQGRGRAERAFCVIMLLELGERSPQRTFPEQNQVG